MSKKLDVEIFESREKVFEPIICPLCKQKLAISHAHLYIIEGGKNKVIGEAYTHEDQTPCDTLNSDSN